MQIHEVLAQLEGVKRTGAGKWTARCCAHEDRKPSLSIREAEGGRVLLHCFSGCSYEAIAAALGIDRERVAPQPIRRPTRIAPQPAPNLTALFEKWERRTEAYMIDGLAMSLGVEVEVLSAIRCAWNGEAWGFPMLDDQKQIIGIRLRALTGRKYAVTGSHQGLFIPRSYPHCVDDATLYLTEGPTDLAAAMTIGLYAIARPSCLGQEQMIIRYIKGLKVRRVVIISDCDNAGILGARKLQQMLTVKSCVFATPTKDLREYVQRGGTATMMESNLRSVTWRAA